MAEEVKAPEVKEPVLSEREKLYQGYKPEDSPVAEPAAQPPVEVEKKEEVKEEVKKEEVKQPEAPDWKAATYEERMKRKAEADLRKKAERERDELAAKVKSYEAPKPEEVITDYDKEIFELKRELRAIKETEAERTDREKKDAFEKVQHKVLSDFDQAHKDLVSEGIPGFKFAKSRLEDELRRLVAEDESNIVLDSPAGWKKIYTEKIYPEMMAEFQEADKTRIANEKTELKKNANLSSSTGKAPIKLKDANDKTEAEVRDDYLASLRKSRGLG